MSKAERKLDYLPDYGAPLSAWRDWLTAALAPADGFRIVDFVRHGRERDDACELIVLGANGNRLHFDIREQRLLSSSASLRATVVGATDGLVRPGSLSKPELEDIWTALVTLATVTAKQDDKAETRDWLDELERNAEKIEGHTLESPARLDALLALTKDRRRFDSVAAREFTDPRMDSLTKARPAVLIDSETARRWMRVGEVAVYLRSVIGVKSMDQAKIDGRLAAIGVAREPYAINRAGSPYVRADLYCRPSAAEERAALDGDPETAESEETR